MIASRAVAVDGELAAMQQHDPVGKPHREIEVVQHGDHGGAVLRALPRRLHQIDLVTHVEAGGRLVQQQKPRAVLRLAAGELHQHAGKMRALLFAAGERRQLPMAEMRQPDLAAAPRRPAAARRRGRLSPAPIWTISSTVNGKVTLTCCDSIAR